MSPEAPRPPIRLPVVRPFTIIKIDTEMTKDMVGFSDKSRALMLEKDPYLAEFILDGGKQIQTMQGDPSGLILGASVVWRMLDEENPNLPPYTFDPFASIESLRLQSEIELLARENNFLAMYLSARTRSFESIATGASFSTGGVATYIQKKIALNRNLTQQ